MDKKFITTDFENIKAQLELLKQHLDNMDKILNVQEELVDLISKNTNLLPKEVLIPVENKNSVNEVMKKFFPKGQLPKILFK